MRNAMPCSYPSGQHSIFHCITFVCFALKNNESIEMGNALEMNDPKVTSINSSAQNCIAEIDDIIADVKAGKPVIFVDDMSRENEGDIVIAAEMITPELINFMIRECGGFICLAIESDTMDRLGLELMPRRNLIDNQAHFTVSIEARYGVDTGVSAKDRCTTILTAIDDTKGADDICTPGHVFPLLAQPQGVLEREGHTEASVDCAKLAGLKGAAVICEIMNKDGTMARLDDLQLFAAAHNLKIGTIEDLVAYRRSEKGAF